jgi:hypothetical protein
MLFKKSSEKLLLTNRFQNFQELMKKRISEVLLVSSPYDLFLFEEDGRLYEQIRDEYQGLHLSHSPEFSRASTAKDAIDLIKENNYDLIITTLHIEDRLPIRFAEEVKSLKPDLPLVLLAYDSRELHNLMLKYDTSFFDKIFIWLGDYRLIVAIIKHLEDKMNVEHDTEIIGVQSIIVIEDNVRHYSAFLPLIYTEIIQQSKRLINEGINPSHRYLRMRARPKILLCNTFEEALNYFNKYEENILGVISDIDFMHSGVQDPEAGFQFVKEVKNRYSDIPIILQSSDDSNRIKAYEVGASFLLKESPTLLDDLRKLIVTHFHFGDFVFRLPDGKEVARASNLIELEKQLEKVPIESIVYHGERNHFSNWLKARTEFFLAEELRPQRVSEFKSKEELRNHLINSIKNYRIKRQRGIITDFSKNTFDPENSFTRIGGGSIGGKARGLSFLNSMLTNFEITDSFKGVKISVPPAVVIGTDVFDQFLDDNKLRNFALNSKDDNLLKKAFLDAKKFPPEILKALKDVIEIFRIPLSVRSSSLLEDSLYHPFAGVYETYMIPNNHPEKKHRLDDLLEAIKLVYASTFYNNSKSYIRMTNFRLEEEKMAIIIQKMVGHKHHNRFYPDFAGVAKSHNFYPLKPLKASDGIVNIALGLGQMVVEGGACYSFCPKYPTKIIHYHSLKEALGLTQREFYGLDLEIGKIKRDRYFLMNNQFTKKYNLSVAETDGVLKNVASTYLADENKIVDGISEPGPRIVNFAPILKNNVFPAAEILNMLLELCSWGMASPVEIEFAVKMSNDDISDFGVLQMRPLVVNQEAIEYDFNAVEQSRILCKSTEILGYGMINNIYDIVFVSPEKFRRSDTRLIANEINLLNSRLLNEGRNYLLIGIGRWGSSDPWLGIPVNWSQICGAKAIVETTQSDIFIEPSQGSHFFQNLTSFSIAYLTVSNPNKDFIDWEWLKSNQNVENGNYVSHIRLKSPLQIILNSHNSIGLILKPNE